MLIKRSKSSSFGPDGRRTSGGGGGCSSAGIGGSCGGGGGCGIPAAAASGCVVGRPLMKKKSSLLFTSGNTIKVQRAPIMTGLSVIPGVSNSVLSKKFQRPMMKRRAYQKGADRALQQSSLGQRKRFDGMAKIMNRAGQGLHFLPRSKENNANSDDDDSDSDDDKPKKKEPDRPFEPLMVWNSPHLGGPCKGLPSRQ